MKQQHQADLKAYQAGDGFIGKYQKMVREVMIPFQYDVLCDRIEDVEKSHVLQNFINAGKALRGEDVGDGFYGMVFQDSDAAKWLEAAAYALANFPDTGLEKTADELIDLVAQAQDTDGYLNTYYTIKDRDKRWTNLQEGHEMYCAGHMIEAACAYYEATGKDKLLKVMEKTAEHIYRLYVEEGREGYPGHPEIELSLLKLYRLTKNPHCLELARHFIDVRGEDPDYFVKEKKIRKWTLWGMDAYDRKYAQCQAPVREQKDAVGHAVRAVYLYTAMADMASESGDKTLLEACRTLWKSITEKRMYITGGIGSTGTGEAFTVDYDLPGDTAYNETCASIGLMFFASRMLENEVDRIYADVMERAFYNTVLAGIQLDGKRFFYVNPLEVVPGVSGVAVTHLHDLPLRPQWYACACCPPNAARLITSLGKYAYGENADTAFCHLYADGEITFQNGIRMICRTAYPYEFTISYSITAGAGQLALRIPGWSKQNQILVNGEEASARIEKGYAYLPVKEGDQISLILDERPYFVYASGKVAHLSARKCICRGPLVYCFEGADNAEDVLTLALKDDCAVEIQDYDPCLLTGTTPIHVSAVRMLPFEGLYSTQAPTEIPCQAIAVPYYTWGNRGLNQMRVWLDRR